MPLIIGDVDACIQMESGPEEAPKGKGCGGGCEATEVQANDDPVQRLAAERLLRERQTEQRDPDRLGGR